jgi:hypothetical protein
MSYSRTRATACCTVIEVDYCKGREKAESTHSIVSLSQWLCPDPTSSNSYITTGSTTTQNLLLTSPLPLVDLRPSDEYSQKCINNSRSSSTTICNVTRVVVNLPMESLFSGQRSFELPPRNIPFAILVPLKYFTISTTNNHVNKVTLDPLLLDFFYATQSKATKKSRVRWTIPQILLEGDSLWADAYRLDILQYHPDFTLFPQPRLWEPDPMVQSCLLPLLRKEISLCNSTKAAVEVWDLGCGSGRDICFLAESLIQYPIQFVGIDNHKGSASRCLPFWERRLYQQQLNRLVTTITKELNLNKISSFQEYLSSSSNALKMIYCVRYNNPKLFHTIAQSACLPPGFLFAVTHFCKETKEATWDYEHPSVSSLLFISYIS